MSLFERCRHHLAGLLLGLVLCGLYANHFIDKTYVEIDLKTYINYKAPVQVYWAEEGKDFSENNVQNRWIYHQNNILRMRVGDLSGKARLRIDPIRYKGHARINSIVVRKSGYREKRFDSPETLAQIIPVNDISSAVLEEDGLVVTTTGSDSQLVIDMDLQKASGIQWHHLINTGLILVFSLFAMGWIAQSFATLSYVPVSLLCAFVMALVMATVSMPSSHPDEKTHFKSIKFYQHHNLPPAVDDPSMVYTYSEYGNSRLVGNEIYYPLAGFYVRMLDDLKLPLYVTARSFSLLLFALIIICAMVSQTFRVIATPLLLTSQAWYNFSYANSDMFAVTVCCLVAWMSVENKSPLNRFLIEDKPDRYLLRVLLLGVALGSLLFLKINYYAFALFIAIYYFWRLWRGDFEKPMQTLARGGLITLVGLSLFGAKFIYDGVINDWDRAARVHQMWDKYADHHYKPSTPLAETHPEMYLRERGNSLTDMLTKHSWSGKSFLTSFGGFGFTQFFAKPGFYEWLKGLLLITVIVLTGAVMIRAPGNIKLLLLITVASVLLVLGISLTASWIRVLQPQGRYLAAILPMTGVLYYHVRSYLPEKLWHTLMLSLFAMAVYSFLFVGIADITKIKF